MSRRGELWTLCLTTLGKDGPQDTRELPRRIAEAKGALAYRVVQALTLRWKRGSSGAMGSGRA